MPHGFVWMRARISIAAAALLSSIGVSGSEQKSDLRTKDCQIANVSEILSRAICAGSAAEVSTYLANIKASEYESIRVPVREALYEIWTTDRSYGHAGSWPQVPNDDVRITIADFLAQSIRNNEIESSLAEYQDVARRLVREAVSASQQATAIRLLGVSNSSADVKLIIKLAEEAKNPSMIRFSAVDALGSICSKEAGDALKSLSASEPGTLQLRRHIVNAIEIRKSLDVSWCQGVTP